MERIDRHFVLSTLGTALLLVLGACGDLECPQGTVKDGKLCRRADASVGMSDSAVIAESSDGGDADARAMQLHDATSPSLDSPQDAPEAGASSSQSEAGPLDAGGATGLGDASPSPDAGAQPTGECDMNRACSPGYSCVEAKCASDCERTKCDANATCALKAGAPVCTCNNGYVAQGTGNSITCARDVACDQLGCHANAACEKGADQLLHCICKPGYVGNGTNCAPVTCESLSIENGTVTGGMNYNDTATYHCNNGYELDLFTGSWTRKCGADKQWSGSAAKCNPVYCGAPPTVAHATVAPATAAPFNATAKYTCDSGYEASGSLTITCGANKQWSAPPSCTAKCGNKRVDRDDGEQCDPSVSGTNKWKCSSTCRELTAYAPCWSNSDCGASENCFEGMCIAFCSGDAACQRAPSGSPITPVCGGRQPNQCALADCQSLADCPPGLVCKQEVGQNGQDRTWCFGCYFNAQCPSGRCVDAAGNQPLLGTFGRCL